VKIIVLFAAAFLSSSAVFADANIEPDAKYSYTRQEDVIYGRKSGTALTLDVFRSTKTNNGAGIILIVSGGWASSHEAINTKFADHFLKRGYTVFAVVHSSQPKFSIPEIIPDVNRAVRFIRFNAKQFGVDASKLGVTGASAGAHLSLILGTQGAPGLANAHDPVDRESSAVQAVACFFPPTDFLNYVKPGKDSLDESVLKNYQKFIGELPESQAARDELGRRISPIYSINSNMAPTLIIHGEVDQHVLLHQATSFIAAARKAGVDAELIVKKGKPHGWPEMSDDVETCADWFDSHLLGIKHAK